MREPSSTSAGATYLDREARVAELRAAAERAREKLPEIERIVLFGSLAHGIPTPRSDADLLVVLSASPEALPRNRVPAVLTALSPLPCPLDLLVLTQEELDRGQGDGSPLLREALAHGIELI